MGAEPLGALDVVVEGEHRIDVCAGGNTTRGRSGDVSWRRGAHGRAVCGALRKHAHRVMPDLRVELRRREVAKLCISVILSRR